MKTSKVIKNTPIKFPFTSTVLYSFLLYYFDASGVIWGIFGTLYVIFWSIAIVVKWNEESVDLFNKEEIKKVKPTFKEQIQKLANETT